jgi:DNA-binding CsgD family transcriptional regulator
MHTHQSRAGEAASEPRVTPREQQVLTWIAAGKSDWEIGQILNISAKTVNFHVEKAKRKFGVATRIQAVVAAIRRGMIAQ